MSKLAVKVRRPSTRSRIRPRACEASYRNWTFDDCDRPVHKDCCRNYCASCCLRLDARNYAREVERHL